MVVNPYLNFAGNTEEAFEFYRSVFGGEFETFQRLGDSPDGSKLPPETQKMIMHIALPIGNGNVLMGTDAPESMGFHLKFGDNFSLCICPDTREDAERMFSRFGEGGKIVMPLTDMFWGAYYGQVTDKFGVQWMINYMENGRQQK